MFRNVWICGGVSVEVERFLNLFQMLGGVRAQNGTVIGGPWLTPGQFQFVLGLERLDGAADSLGTFGMAPRGIFSATGISDNLHENS
jgi:hypothetical protein